ncbi:unnamed protein product [Paramecium octaurelia]|uniref:Uncharacterized protein n=1 Tax=Paramecium octaurelia TaxID=43137 RepID=A0A8S1UWY2_PAROT|nr:unnamed protein product [Paramecium octaurelia]
MRNCQFFSKKAEQNQTKFNGTQLFELVELSARLNNYKFYMLEGKGKM